MTNLILDIDDTAYAFTDTFIKFINNRLQRSFTRPIQPLEWGSQEVFGIGRAQFDYLLKNFTEHNNFRKLPYLKGFWEAACWFHNNEKAYGHPHYITLREPNAFIQTFNSLQSLYSDMHSFHAAQSFHLHIANPKHQTKAKIINSIRHWGEDDTVFIDDNPTLINQVAKECPGVLTIWLNTLNFHPEIASPHYLVSTWSEVIDLLKSRDHDLLLKHSMHPEEQLSLV